MTKANVSARRLLAVATLLLSSIMATAATCERPDGCQAPPATVAVPSGATKVGQTVTTVYAFRTGQDSTAVAQGDYVEFSASGTWNSGISQTGPNGDCSRGAAACGACPVTSGNLGELVGVIDDGTPFRIGSKQVIQASSSGMLSLIMNENTGPCTAGEPMSCYKDNVGNMTVTVTVWKA